MQCRLDTDRARHWHPVLEMDRNAPERRSGSWNANVLPFRFVKICWNAPERRSGSFLIIVTFSLLTKFVIEIRNTLWLTLTQERDRDRRNLLWKQPVQVHVESALYRVHGLHRSCRGRVRRGRMGASGRRLGACGRLGEGTEFHRLSKVQNTCAVWLPRRPF